MGEQETVLFQRKRLTVTNLRVIVATSRGQTSIPLGEVASVETERQPLMFTLWPGRRYYLKIAPTGGGWGSKVQVDVGKRGRGKRAAGEATSIILRAKAGMASKSD